MDLVELAASWSLGLTPRETVPSICLDLLNESTESEALATLASYGPNDLTSEETNEMLTRALAEIGLEMPSRRAAADSLARRLAEDALAGRLKPEAAAKRIARDILDAVRDLADDHEYVGDAFGFEGVFGLHDDYEELAEGARCSKAEVDADAKRVFAKLLARGHAV